MNEKSSRHPIDDPRTPEQEDRVYQRGRHPSDLLRLLSGVLAGAVGFALASVLDNVSVGITIDVIDVFDALPAPIVVTAILAVQAVAWIVPVAVVAVLLIWRRYRRVTLLILAVATAAALSWGVQGELTSRLTAPDLAIEAPSWICSNVTSSPEQVVGVTDPGAIFASNACVPGDGFPSLVYIAGLAAGFSALTPWLSRRWRSMGWLLMVAFLATRLIDGLGVPVDALLIVALGYTTGAAVLLAFGSPDRSPTTSQVAEALARNGIEVSDIRSIKVDEGTSRLYSGSAFEGEPIFVKVRTSEERAAELMYRAYRMIRLKGFGDERPFASLRREVEHEAVMSLTAAAAGVRTPVMLRVADVTPTSVLIAFRGIEASTLEAAGPDGVGDGVLRSIWEQLDLLHTARIAHRHLSLANIVLSPDGKPLIVGFGFAEMSAEDQALNGDIAQLLVSVALVVGPDRAVSAAVNVMGTDAVALAAPRLQLTALSSSTRAAVKRQKGMLKTLLAAVKNATGLDNVELEKLERVSARMVLTAAMLGLAFYILIPQLADVDFNEVLDAEWQWFPLVLLFSLMTYCGAAIALIGAMPTRLRFFPTLLAQIAASFFNRIAPAKVGGIAANIRYLQKSGVDPSVAIAGVGLNNIAGVVVHVVLLAIFVTTAGRSASNVIALPSGQAVLVVLVGLLTMAGAVMLLPWGRKIWLRRVLPIVRKSSAGISTVASDPIKMLSLFGGSVVITMSYVFALWYSLAAFGGGLGFVAVTAVYLTGSALAQAAPTPGGIGAAEAALIAGLTAFGLEASVAVPAVFLFRLGTFWFPILPGYLAYRRLAAQGVL